MAYDLQQSKRDIESIPATPATPVNDNFVPKITIFGKDCGMEYQCQNPCQF